MQIWTVLISLERLLVAGELPLTQGFQQQMLSGESLAAQCKEMILVGSGRSQVGSTQPA